MYTSTRSSSNKKTSELLDLINIAFKSNSKPIAFVMSTIQIFLPLLHFFPN